MRRGEKEGTSEKMKKGREIGKEMGGTDGKMRKEERDGRQSKGLIGERKLRKDRSMKDVKGGTRQRTRKGRTGRRDREGKGIY